MRVGIVTKHNLAGARDTLVTLESWLAERRVDVAWAPDAAELMPSTSRRVVPRHAIVSEVDLVLVLGGDGTLLAIADLVGQLGLEVPILGVNFGSLGFLTEITRPELFTALDAAVTDVVEHDHRMMLRGCVGASSRVALNDIVLTVGDQFVTSVRSDGLIIASPTGSTAYNLSAGGPVVHPAMDAFVLTPIAPHTLTHRPIVIPAEREVRVRAAAGNAGAEIYVTFDGQHGFPLPDGAEVVVTRSPKSLRLVRAATRSYFEVLREKLKWGER